MQIMLYQLSIEDQPREIVTSWWKSCDMGVKNRT